MLLCARRLLRNPCRWQLSAFAGRLELHCAWRMQHPAIWRKYRAEVLKMQSDLHARGIKPQSPGLRENFQQAGMALPGGTGCESINECFLLHGTRPDSVLDNMNEEERPPGTEVGITFWLWLPQVIYTSARRSRGGGRGRRRKTRAPRAASVSVASLQPPAMGTSWRASLIPRPGMFAVNDNPRRPPPPPGEEEEEEEAEEKEGASSTPGRHHGHNTYKKVDDA